MLLGWCPGTLSVADTLAAYPGTRTVRVFRSGSQTLPAWSSSTLASILTAGAVPHLSFKRWDLPALVRWLNGMPGDARLILTYHHEPEQQAGDDPAPKLFRSRWADLVTMLAVHPARSQITLVPVFTHYWWENHPGDRSFWPGDDAGGIDAVGWDVYNESTSRYRDPVDMLRLCRDFATEVDKPYLIAEWGAERVVGDDGTRCAAWMRAFVDQARADGAVTATWFHFRGDDLLAAGRAVEQQTLHELIEQEASVTRAPANLLAVRRLLLDHLDIDPRKGRSIDLESAEVGIVGDRKHYGGYHCGSDRVDRNSAGTIIDYSVVESSRDRAGLTLDAAALDVGMFEVTVGGRTYDLPHFSAWCVGQCKAGAPDTRDIREIIWSPDTRTVRRWDALGRRSTGDDSHRSHTHFSFFRDAIKAGRDLTPLFRRYLTTIGLPEDDMPLTDAEIDKVATAAAAKVWGTMWRGTDKDYPAASWLRNANTYAARGMAAAVALAGLPAQLAALAGRVDISADEAKAVAAALAPAIIAQLPANGTVTDEQLERVLRKVLGSVDNPAKR